ncbi:hypothetical protein [Fannyhessea vaginae]|uniref:hypothetical protein n=1 Tax=Fannyhessea vaginae TaxID=82135 RepID=UPI0023F1C4C8|nr:hypothetical protein [Fannyhessea vaginae]
MIANKAFTCVEMSEERIYTGDYEFIKEAGEYIAICRYCPASKKALSTKTLFFCQCLKSRAIGQKVCK